MIQPFRLARIAAEAEGVRLRGLITRMVVRVVFAVVALLFVIGALTFAHVAAWYVLRTTAEQSFLITAGILGGADLLIAVILLFLASRSSPSRVEQEALDVRRRAIQGIGGAFSMAQMAMPMVRLASNFSRRRRKA